MYKTLITLFFLLPLSLFAVDNSYEEDLNGFDEEETTVDNIYLDGFEDEDIFSVESSESLTQKKWSLHGFLTFSTVYNYEHEKPQANEMDNRGFSRARSTLNFDFDYKFSTDTRVNIEGYSFYDAIFNTKGRNKYSSIILDTYESEFEFQESYINSRINNNFEVTIGRQIIVWGKSDNIRITDVINPMDNREPAMVDIENLRLAVGMTKFDYTRDAWNYSLALIHESRFSRTSVPGSDFFPLPIDKLPNGSFPEEENKAFSLKNTQYALSASARFEGWDLSLYTAKLFYDKFYFQDNKRKYSPVNMAGVSYNGLFGSYLIKLEGAYFDSLRYTATQNQKSRLDLLVGIDYNGFKDTTMTLELANRHIYNYENKMRNLPDSVYEDEQLLAFRVTQDYLNETLKITYLSSLMLDKKIDGGFHRLWAEYDIMDGMDITLGIVDYIGGDNLIYDALKKNDRIFLTFRYYY